MRFLGLKNEYSRVSRFILLCQTCRRQSSEWAVKRVLGGIVVIIEGIGNLRNIFGDAHGKSIDSENPDVRHAEFAVNIAGALSTFLISACEAQKSTT